MKKLLALLLMVVLLVSLSAAAFADDSDSVPKKIPSPSQDVVPSDGGEDTGAGAGTKPTEEEKTVAAVETVAANDSITVDEDSSAAVGTEGLDKASEETQEAVNAVAEQKEEATAALKDPKNVTKAISNDKDLADKADGKTADATDPQEIWSSDEQYPCKIKYTTDHHVDVILLFIDGAWEVPEDLEIVDNEDGTCTVSFTLNAPALFTEVTFK